MTEELRKQFDCLIEKLSEFEPDEIQLQLMEIDNKIMRFEVLQSQLSAAQSQIEILSKKGCDNCGEEYLRAICETCWNDEGQRVVGLQSQLSESLSQIEILRGVLERVQSLIRSHMVYEKGAEAIIKQALVESQEKK